LIIVPVHLDTPAVGMSPRTRTMINSARAVGGAHQQ